MAVTRHTIRPGGEVVLTRAEVSTEDDSVQVRAFSRQRWTIFAHPLFIVQLQGLTQQVEALKQKDPVDHVKKNASKRLAAIGKLPFESIPQDPARPEYRQGATHSGDHKHWFRARFFQQYRLFFRYHAPSRVIVYAWVNDDDTKRAYESGDDALRMRRIRRTISA